MNSILKLWNKSFVRFLFVGGVNTILGYLYYSFFLQFVRYTYALTAGYIIGIITSYMLNSWIVFRKPLVWNKFFQFPVVYIIQYLVSLFVTFISVEVVGINEQWAFIIAILITIPITFTISRLIIDIR